jgi:type III secretory pathway lipoprotein EscJ
LLLCAACDVTIAHGLSDAEARALSATLNREGIAVSSERQGYGEPRYQLAITPSAVPRAVAALRAADLPAPPERERALQKRVSEALSQLPGVRRAAVQISLTSATPSLSELLGTAGTPPRATLTLVRDARTPLDAAQARQLAASLVPDLEPERVELHEQSESALERPCAELSHLGEVTVTSATLATLKLWLAGSLIVHMATAVALLVLLQRRRAREASADVRKPR